MSYIDVSSSGVQSRIMFPSGLIPQGVAGSALLAYLTSCNSTFGFNTSPHSFDMTFIPTGSKEIIHGASGELPAVGTELSLMVGDFLIKGFITHAEYNVSPGGTVVSVNMEDKRRILKKVKVTTDDLGSTRPSGVVSVPAELRELYNFNVNESRDIVTWEYRKMLERGATYAEIYQALANAHSKGNIAIDYRKLPAPDIIASNIGGNDAEAIRFQFGMSPLDEVVDTVMKDTAYDWYWNMNQDAVSVINRKQVFSISEDSIFEKLGNAEYKTLRFGQDAVNEPSRVRLLGARQQGFWNSDLLSPIDGIDLQASGTVFYPAWRNLTVQFVDYGGQLRSYRPTDFELQMSLAGVEQWTYFKIYQTASASAEPPGFDMDSDAGSIAAQHPEFQSRIDPTMPLSEYLASPSGNFRLINNRRDTKDNWVLKFFNRVEDLAQRHFGKSYVASGICYNQESGYIRVVDSAWANVENQVEGQSFSEHGNVGPFIAGYKINKRLGPIAPFIQGDFRVSAYCALPSGTLYGVDGEDVPTSFMGWTEDVPPYNPSGTYKHYVPVKLAEVGQKVLDPRDDSDLYNFQEYPDGTIWCQFPNMVVERMASGTVLDTLTTLIKSINSSTASGEIDFMSPSLLVYSYTEISGVAIPVEIMRRYGQGYPDTWVSGTLHPQMHEHVSVDESFAPWNYFPVGNRGSLQVMNIYAKNRLEGLYIDATQSRYAEISQVGYPQSSFDDFASQAVNSLGQYGIRNHGIGSMSFSYGNAGIVTTYRINDFFPVMTRIPPLGDRDFPAFMGPIHPIDFDIFDFDTSPARTMPAEKNVRYYTEPESYHKRVIIIEVHNILDVTVGGSAADAETYFGKTPKQRVQYPNPNNRNFDGRLMTDGAECIDGFLDEGDECQFHYESEGTSINSSTTYYYFTGGHPLSMRVLEVTEET